MQPSGQSDQILARVQWRAVSRSVRGHLVDLIFMHGSPLGSSIHRHPFVIGCAEEGARHRLDKKRGDMMGRQAVTGRDDTSPNRHPWAHLHFKAHISHFWTAFISQQGGLILGLSPLVLLSLNYSARQSIAPPPVSLPFMHTFTLLRCPWANCWVCLWIQPCSRLLWIQRETRWIMNGVVKSGGRGGWVESVRVRGMVRERSCRPWQDGGRVTC